MTFSSSTLKTFSVGHGIEWHSIYDNDGCAYGRSEDFRHGGAMRHFRAFWERPKRKRQRSEPALVGKQSCLQICDGDFDRWANSVGAEVPMTWASQEEFDAAIKTLVYWSGVRGASEAHREFPVAYGPEFDEFRKQFPHLLLLSGDLVEFSKEEQRYVPVERVRDLVGSMRGRTYVQQWALMFERDTDFVMAKLAFG